MERLPSRGQVSGVGYLLRNKGVGCTEQAQLSPPPFFCGCRLSAAAAGSHPTDDGKIHRCRRRSVGRDREQQTAAGVQLAGLQEGGNVKERKRKNPIFAAGKIMPCSSVVSAVPRRRQQIKGAGGGRRRRKKRRAAGRKTAL